MSLESGQKHVFEYLREIVSKFSLRNTYQGLRNDEVASSYASIDLVSENY